MGCQSARHGRIITACFWNFQWWSIVLHEIAYRVIHQECVAWWFFKFAAEKGLSFVTTVLACLCELDRCFDDYFTLLKLFGLKQVILALEDTLPLDSIWKAKRSQKAISLFVDRRVGRLKAPFLCMPHMTHQIFCFRLRFRSSLPPSREITLWRIHCNGRSIRKSGRRPSPRWLREGRSRRRKTWSQEPRMKFDWMSIKFWYIKRNFPVILEGSK